MSPTSLLSTYVEIIINKDDKNLKEELKKSTNRTNEHLQLYSDFDIYGTYQCYSSLKSFTPRSKAPLHPHIHPDTFV